MDRKFGLPNGFDVLLKYLTEKVVIFKPEDTVGFLIERIEELIQGRDKNDASAYPDYMRQVLEREKSQSVFYLGQ